MDTTTIIAIVAVVIFMCAMGGLVLYSHTPSKGKDGGDENAKSAERR
jgi:hypothetical protein